MHQGWERYTPVGLPGSADLLQLDRSRLGQQFSSELLAFVDREITAKVAEVQMRIDSRPRSPRWPNRLGTIYARYGLDDEAIAHFEHALELEQGYAPALVNLGTISYLSGDLVEALDYYEQAEQNAPDNADVLLNIARVNHELENYGMARRAYSRLQESPRRLRTASPISIFAVRRLPVRPPPVTRRT